MTLDNISYCRYLADITERWESDHFKVAKIVRTLKGEPFNGYADLQVGSGWKRLDSDHREVAIEWFVSTVEAQTQFDPGVHILCPIPDSQSTPSSKQPPRTLLLAQALSKRFTNLKIWDHLRFQRPMGRRIRDEELLFQNLVCTASVPAEYIILLDDVCTSGSHARAAQRRLRGRTAKDICGMSVARTMLDPNEQVFGYRSDSL